MKFLAPIDLTKNELQNAVIHVLPSDPSSPSPGQIYYNSASGYFFGWNGDLNQWDNLSQGGGGGGGDADTLDGEDGSYYLNRANHTGTNDADTLEGSDLDYVLDRTNHTGTQTASTISDLAATVQAYALSSFAVPTGDVDFDGYKLTGLADPSADDDAANKRYVDLVAQGFKFKGTAYVATAAVLPNTPTYSNGSSGVGATLTAGANSTLTVDGVVVPVNSFVLVKDQAAAEQNGLYQLTTAGSGAAAWVLTRADNMNTTGEFVGAFVVIEDAGSTIKNRAYLCTNSTAPTVGTTGVTFSQLAGVDYTGTTNRITITGLAIDISASYAGQASIITVGTITTGTWQGTAIAVAYGGTGATDAAGARSNLDVPQTPYSATVGDNSTTTFNITAGTHGRAGNGKLLVKLYEVSSGDEVFANVSVNNSNGTVTLVFAVAPTTNQYRVVISG